MSAGGRKRIGKLTAPVADGNIVGISVPLKKMWKNNILFILLWHEIKISAHLRT